MIATDLPWVAVASVELLLLPFISPLLSAATRVCRVSTAHRGHGYLRLRSLVPGSPWLFSYLKTGNTQVERIRWTCLPLITQTKNSAPHLQMTLIITHRFISNNQLLTHTPFSSSLKAAGHLQLLRRLFILPFIKITNSSNRPNLTLHKYPNNLHISTQQTHT